MPKYHFVQQNAKGAYLDSEDLAINQRQKTQSKHWSLAVGFEYLAENTHSKIGLYLHYTRFNAGVTLNQLNFEDQGYTKSRYNTPAIGITLRLSTGFKKQL